MISISLALVSSLFFLNTFAHASTWSRAAMPTENEIYSMTIESCQKMDIKKIGLPSFKRSLKFGYYGNSDLDKYANRIRFESLMKNFFSFGYSFEPDDYTLTLIASKSFREALDSCYHNPLLTQDYTNSLIEVSRISFYLAKAVQLFPVSKLGQAVSMISSGMNSVINGGTAAMMAYVSYEFVSQRSNSENECRKTDVNQEACMVSLDQLKELSQKVSLKNESLISQIDSKLAKLKEDLKTAESSPLEKSIQEKINLLTAAKNQYREH